MPFVLLGLLLTLINEVVKETKTNNPPWLKKLIKGTFNVYI